MASQSLEEIDSILREAMDRRKTIELEYRGEDELRFHQREFEPWCYGIHATTGNRVLRAYQTAGHSESGMPDELPFWRLARLDRMRNVTIGSNDIREQSPPHYNPEDKHMREIYVALPE
jgi:predicted DNA-binding transcriptional regulator YafY